jgi:ribosome-associated translation inhibitor RaiA
MLHKYNDGSVLKVMTARELVALPTWKGQRILDKSHSDSIKAAVGSNVQSLDSGYSIVKYKEEATDGSSVISTYLIDGQHRASVIRDYYLETVCEADFNVTVMEKTVESESDAIIYFNKINNVKAQQWRMDPNLLINNYISALEKVFNKNKKCMLIRPTNIRPYLSSANLREALANNTRLLKNGKEDVAKYVEAVVKYNKEMVTKFSLDLTQAETKDYKLKERAVAVGFALAYDTKLKWVRELLCG